MAVGFEENGESCSKLLELAAFDDLAGFIHEVEEMGSDVNKASNWYGRRFGSMKMGFQERTPLMISSLYGSIQVLKYVLGARKVDVNRACGLDGATPLHCAAAGGSWASVEAVKLLIEASGDVDSFDSDGNKPCDVIASCVKSSKRKTLEKLLKGIVVEEGGDETPRALKDGSERKEYPVDMPLPDINIGLYGSDEFRMYTFKVKPCSRAYSHDWTECPFVHPGENARRRDLMKHGYTCVPCPEFKKGSCAKGDSCEFAHGVFESWLHPAQYRTRLCKDGTGCSRKVCFFAHKPEELRPLYASTGSAMPSPNSVLPPMAGSTWQSKINPATPPALQLAGSRLKTTLRAQNVDFELEKVRTQQHQQLVEDAFDPSLLSQLQSVSPKVNNPSNSHMHSLAGHQIRHNTSLLRSSYPSSIPTSLPRKQPSAAIMNSRSNALSKRSQSFIDRGGVSYRSSLSGSTQTLSPMPSKLSDWNSPNGKLEWGFNDEEVNKLRKSASFGFRSNGFAPAAMTPRASDEPDVSWVNSLVKDVPSGGIKPPYEYGVEQLPGGIHDMLLPNWMEQLYMEQKQMVA